MKKAPYIGIGQAGEPISPPTRAKEDNMDTKDKELHRAIGRGATQKALQLIKEGAYINAEDRKGNTPLHKAVQKGNKRFVSRLLSAGAYVDSEGRGKMTPLHIAARKGDKEIALLLLERRADLHAESIRNLTPLHNAVFSQSVEMVTLLLDKGAHIHARGGSRYETALHIAMRWGLKGVADKLIEAGADLHAIDGYLRTPLDEEKQYKAQKESA